MIHTVENKSDWRNVDAERDTLQDPACMEDLIIIESKIGYS
jgi:hypothetical protein